MVSPLQEIVGGEVSFPPVFSENKPVFPGYAFRSLKRPFPKQKRFSINEQCEKLKVQAF